MKARLELAEQEFRAAASDPATPPHILMLVGDTIGKQRRTGIQRVVIETARALAPMRRFDMVRWDAVEGRLRFLDMDELNDLFGPGAWPEGLGLRPTARRIGRPFHEQLEDPTNTWIVATEVGWHQADGVEFMARAMAHCRQWGGRFAAVFYDLIPIRNQTYAGAAELHESYVAELMKADLIVPISRTAGDDLSALWRERGLSPHPPITPLLLPDGGFGGRMRLANKPGRRIVLFGTVEPRKRQLEFLRAFETARRANSEILSWDVVVAGNLHGHVAKAFQAMVARSDWLTHLDYISDAALAELLAGAAFTAFPSDDEGYGLPIAESLAAQVPCLCAEFGSMAEIAAGGGCLTIDVRRPDALQAAIVELCTQPQTLDRLRAEIAARRFESWTTYARALIGLLSSHQRPASSAAAPTIEAAGPRFASEAVDDADFERLAGADVACCPSPAAIEAFVAEAARRAWPALLPPALPPPDAAEHARALAGRRRTRLSLASLERGYAKARQAIRPEWQARRVFLRVLISTFNRRDFVLANVRWILGKVFANAEAPVELVVVDGGSTDGTVEQLYGVYDRRLRIVECPVNVGMLGGLREAARILGAEYTWLVGDDDFIDPAGFRDLLHALRTNAGIPFAFTNFSVYHRAAMGPADIPQRLLLEGRPVAEGTAPSGMMPVREAAAQTDNLFTAIYAIVWRSDLLSAAFEHGFDGPPFADLTQAIPCSEFILGRHGDCDAYWRAEPGIVGNAHNSWSVHRPRWHGVIMPLALDLAREAGVDPVRLQLWADLHRKLLDEAVDIDRAEGRSTAFGPEHADLAFRIFRGLPSEFSAP